MWSETLHFSEVDIPAVPERESQNAADSWAALSALLWQQETVKKQPAGVAEKPAPENPRTACAPHETPEHLKEAAGELAANSEDPRGVLVQAVKNNNVVGYSDYHREPSPHIDMLIDSMAAMKDAGATHLAMELDAEMQPLFDDFMKTGKISDELRSLIFMSHKTPNNMIRVMEAAHANGLKIVGVDKSYHAPDRDKVMADGISKILKSSPNSKVIYFAGSLHQMDSYNGADRMTAVQRLRKDGTKVETVFHALFADKSDASDLAMETDRVRSVQPDDAPRLAQLQTGAGSKADKWDHVIVYPAAAGFEKVAEEAKASNARPLDVVSNTVRNNQVTFVTRPDSGYGITSKMNPTFEAFAIDAVKQARKEGATHLAISVPPSFQPALEQFNRTGELDTSTALSKSYRADEIKNLINVMKAARTAGLKLLAVDTRKDDIVSNLSGLVEQDKNAKVVFLGSAYNNQEYESGDNLTAQLRSRGVSAGALLTISEISGEDSHEVIARFVCADTAIDMEKARATAALRTQDHVRLGSFNHLLVLRPRA